MKITCPPCSMFKWSLINHHNPLTTKHLPFPSESFSNLHIQPLLIDIPHHFRCIPANKPLPFGSLLDCPWPFHLARRTSTPSILTPCAIILSTSPSQGSPDCRSALLSSSIVAHALRHTGLPHTLSAGHHFPFVHLPMRCSPHTSPFLFFLPPFQVLPRHPPILPWCLRVS